MAWFQDREQMVGIVISAAFHWPMQVTRGEIGATSWQKKPQIAKGMDTRKERQVNFEIFHNRKLFSLLLCFEDWFHKNLKLRCSDRAYKQS